MAAESASTTAPETLRCPRFCACAAKEFPCVGKGAIPAAKAVTNTAAASPAFHPFTLPPRLPRRTRLLLHRDLRLPWSARADRLRLPHTPAHPLRTRPHLPLPVHRLRGLNHFRIPGSLARQPPLSRHLAVIRWQIFAERLR